MCVRLHRVPSQSAAWGNSLFILLNALKFRIHGSGDALCAVAAGKNYAQCKFTHTRARTHEYPMLVNIERNSKSAEQITAMHFDCLRCAFSLLHNGIASSRCLSFFCISFFAVIDCGRTMCAGHCFKARSCFNASTSIARMLVCVCALVFSSQPMHLECFGETQWQQRNNDSNRKKTIAFS